MLTVLTAIAVVGQIMITRWLHSMIWSDTTREFWEPIFVRLGIGGWFFIVIPWYLFSLSHLVVVTCRVFRTRSDFRHFPYYLMRLIGFGLFISGSIATIYFLFAIATHSQDVSLPADRWPLIVCISEVLIGILIICLRPFLKPR